MEPGKECDAVSPISLMPAVLPSLAPSLMSEALLEKKETLRLYNSEHVKNFTSVRDTYSKQRKNQTVDYLKKAHNKYLTFEKPMSMWEALKLMDKVVDTSDPDISIPNLHHLLQTAEQIRLE
eukprot:Selendium_serpulae@DN7138_c0_g1_i1.p2